MNLLRGPISHLRSSPYRCTAPVLGATSARSLRFLPTLAFESLFAVLSWAAPKK